MSDKITVHIKEFRQALMGLGILSVLAVHLYYMGYFPDVVSLFLKDSTMFVYVEGFLFLSGFGLYYSCSSNTLFQYYKKRVKRLLLPYVILMSPYIIITSFLDGESLWLIIARIFGVSFWIEGNYASMWYVHVLLLLYAIYPLFHKAFFNDTQHFASKFILLCVVYGCLLYGVSLYFPLFFSNCSFALYRIPFFFFGACVAYSFIRHDNSLWLVLWLVSYIVISISNCSENLESVRHIYFAVYLLPLLALAVGALHQIRHYAVLKLLFVLNWFGRYTLEIYILHLLIMLIVFRLGYDMRISIITGELLAVSLCSFVHVGLKSIIK